MNIYTEEFTPTYLYIKQHSITGKLYFGKTVKDPEKYPGSGKHWYKHIKKHGKEHVLTLWYRLFYDKESISEFALMFSEQHNIVESKEWLNLIPENGLDGGSTNTGISPSIETRRKISISNTNPSDETRLRMSASAKLKPSVSLVAREKMSISASNRSLEYRQTMSIAKSNPSLKTRDKMSVAKKGRNQPIVTCPHCLKSGGNMMHRWHFDNCKLHNSLVSN